MTTKTISKKIFGLQLSTAVCIGLAIATLAIVASCKKSPASYPIVEFISPSEGSFFSVPDTVHVQAKVMDENLRTVVLGLANEDFMPVGSSYSIEVTAPEVTVNTTFAIVDKYLPSGTYYLHIRASNGDNATNKFHKIKLNETPKRFRGILTGINGANGGNVILVDSVLNPQVFHTYQSGVGRTIASSRMGMVLAGPIQPGMVKGWDMYQNTVFEENYTEPIMLPAVSAAGQNHDAAYLGLGDGRVWRWANNTQPTHWKMPQSYFAKHIFPYSSNERIVVIGRQRGGNNIMFYQVRGQNGFVFKDEQVFWEPVACVQINSQELMLFGQHDGQGRMMTFNLQSGHLTPFNLLHSPPIKDAVYVGNNQIYLATVDGLYLLSLQPLNIVKANDVPAPERIALDEINRNLVLQYNGGLVLRRLPGLNQVGSVSLPSGVPTDLMVVYNK